MTLAARVLVGVLFVAAPIPAMAQGFSLQGAAGSHLGEGGTLISASAGFAPVSRLTLLVNVERIHIPTDVRRYDDGYGATRGGTTTFVSGEMRIDIRGAERPTPYVLVGYGRGVTKPNVDELFPTPVTNDTGLLYAGLGVRAPIGERWSVFADTRFLFHAERDSLGFLLPVRAGAGLRF